MNDVKLTKAQRKHVNEIQQKLLKMLQSPVSQPYSSSDSSSVIILGKLPSSQKKNSTAEHKSAAGESEKKSIMSIGSFGEELNKLRKHMAEREKRQKGEGSGKGGDGGGGSEGVSPVPNIDPDLYKTMKDAMNLGVFGHSAPSTNPSKKHSAGGKPITSCVTHGEGVKTAPGVAPSGRNSRDRERERDCEQKSESNNNSNKISLASTKNETSCSCPSDAEP